MGAGVGVGIAIAVGSITGVGTGLVDASEAGVGSGEVIAVGEGSDADEVSGTMSDGDGIGERLRGMSISLVAEFVSAGLGVAATAHEANTRRANPVTSQNWAFVTSANFKTPTSEGCKIVEGCGLIES